MLTNSISTHDDLQDSLSPTDRELFSLFLQYPEIDFDSDEVTEPQRPESAQTACLDSSPISTLNNKGSKASLTDHDGTSTAFTTPSRPPVKDEEENKPNEHTCWDEFEQLLQQTNLPQRCLDYCAFIGQSILDLGASINETARLNQSPNLQAITDTLLNNIEYSSKQVVEQEIRISNLKALVTFNVMPSAPYLWSTYYQRAKLIAKNVSLPDKHELKLVEMLTFLYDAYVYNEFLALPQSVLDQDIQYQLHTIYHKLMTWLNGYKQWCKGMQELRTRYMKPLLDQLVVSQEAQDEVMDFQDRIVKAQVALTKPVQVSDVEMTDKIIKSLHLSGRGPGLGPTGSLKRWKRRAKREHTL